MAKPNAKKQVGTYAKFGPWFKAQFPLKRRSAEEHVRLLDRAEALEGTAEIARFAARMSEHAEAVHDAALKGWVAGYEAAKAELGLTEHERASLPSKRKKT